MLNRDLEREKYNKGGLPEIGIVGRNGRIAEAALAQLIANRELLFIGQLDPFGLRGLDFSTRVPEKSEIFTGTDAQIYIDGCDYPESADDLLLALEVQQLFGPERIRRMSMLDAMCGPGRLG